MDAGSEALESHETSGHDAAALAEATAGVKSAIDQGVLAGAVTLVWRQGEILDLQTLGMADLAQGRAMAPDTLFRIASMSKPVTSVAALMLMEEGAFSLDEPITRWAPEFKDMQVLKDARGPLDETYPAPREITFDDLLTHRAGLAYGFSSVGPIAYAHEQALGDVMRTNAEPDDWMAALGSLPLSYPPGERFHYSHATDVLGFLVGRIAGMPFREFLMQRIFQPLGMADTDFWIPPEKRDRAAAVYRVEESGLEPVDFPQRETPPVWCGGGGGLVSTAHDYLTFSRLLLNGGEVDGVRLLRPQTVEAMRANRLTEAQRQLDFLGMPFWTAQGFGLGLSMVMDAEKHAWMGAGSEGSFGWPGAFGTWWQADPAAGVILIYLIQNSMPLGPEAVTQIASSRGMGARIALPMWQKAVYAALGH